MQRYAFLFLIVASMPVAAKEIAPQPANGENDMAARLGGSSAYQARMLAWNTVDTSGEAVRIEAPLPTMRRTSSYGMRNDPIRGNMRFHAGIDLQGVTGEPVFASADGKVTVARAARSGYGNMVEIDHGAGTSTRYAHLSRILVANGGRVARGDVIGLVGSTGRSTGSHLHYEVRFNGLAADPLPFLGSTIATKVIELSEPVIARWSGWSPDIGATLPISQIK